MQVIGGKLLGYNRQQVDEHLAGIRETRNNEIALIRDDIEECRQERQLLNRELESLRQERERYAGTGGLLNFALSRVKNAVELINRASEEDASKISAEIAHRIAVHHNYEADIEKEIKQTKLRMEAVLQSILQLSSDKDFSPGAEDEGSSRKVVGTIFSPDSKSEIVSAMGEDVVGKTVVSPNGVQVGRVGNLFIDHGTREIKGFYLKDGRFVPADCVMAVKKDSLVISVDWQKTGVQHADRPSGGKLESLKNLLEKQLTADGAAAPQKPQAEISGPKESGHVAPVGVACTPGGTDLTAAVEDFGGFWGDVPEADATYTAANVEEVPADGVAAREAPSLDHPVQDDGVFAQSREDLADETFFAGVPETASTAEQSFADHQDLAPGAPELPVKPGGEGLSGSSGLVSSPAVSREIKAVRHKYVVGKLAGEDLLDNEGSLLIGKGQLITPSIVEKAEKEGKLAELIINMVIPGLEQ